MKKALYIAIIVIAGCWMSGCSDVGFENLPKLSCKDVTPDENVNCFGNGNSITISITFGVGDVDILFVDDNSGSMSVEQAKMANAFPNFLNNISNLFYRIGIITTDVSASPDNATPRPANGMGKFQDGQLIEFTNEAKQPSGLFAINYNTPNVAGLFRGTIQRQESLVCDANKYNPAHCPSSDERGIYAANLAVQRADTRFFRPGAHLAIVILSDEDERSSGGQPGFPGLEANDLPESLVTNTAAAFASKSLSVHSIVTNNEACRLAQTQNPPNSIFPLRGFIGTQYMKLSSPSASMLALGNLVPGHTGTICTSDFGAQMGSISSVIRDRTFDAPKKLACSPSADDIRITTVPAGSAAQIDYFIDGENKVHFSNVPLGTIVTFEYDCPRF